MLFLIAKRDALGGMTTCGTATGRTAKDAAETKLQMRLWPTPQPRAFRSNAGDVYTVVKW